MNKHVITLILLIVSFSIFAQNISKDSIINFDELSENEIYNIQNEGWTLTSLHNKISLTNFSNKDYILFFPIHCKESKMPSFLIEFTNNYRDGYRGGLDFTSSKSERFKKIVFLIDEEMFENPFKNYDKVTFENFRTALKKGTTLTIKFFDNEMNPDTGKKELILNRAIDFKLNNNHLLDETVDCEK